MYKNCNCSLNINVNINVNTARTRTQVEHACVHTRSHVSNRTKPQNLLNGSSFEERGLSKYTSENKSFDSAPIHVTIQSVGVNTTTTTTTAFALASAFAVFSSTTSASQQLPNKRVSGEELAAVENMLGRVPRRYANTA